MTCQHRARSRGAKEFTDFLNIFADSAQPLLFAENIQNYFPCISTKVSLLGLLIIMKKFYTTNYLKSDSISNNIFVLHLLQCCLSNCQYFVYLSKLIQLASLDRNPLLQKRVAKLLKFSLEINLQQCHSSLSVRTVTSQFKIYLMVYFLHLIT